MSTIPSSPNPSPEAQDVAKWDQELRAWLNPQRSARGFDPHWDESRDLRANERTPLGDVAAVVSGWGAPLDLDVMVRTGSASASAASAAAGTSPTTSSPAASEPSATSPKSVK